MQCYIQQQGTKKMIGSLEVFEGLYFLNLKEKNVYAFTINASFVTLPNNNLLH